MANVSQLHPALVPQVETHSSEPAEKDADFLALRLLNKRARVRLSPEPIDLSSLPGKACLFAMASSKGWFAAIVRDANASALILSPLADLRSALESASSDDDLPYQPQRRVPVGGSIPTYVVFACNDAKLLLGLLDGSISVYSMDQLLRGDGFVNPMHVFPSTPSTILLSIQPNPVDIPELVAVLRDCTKSPGALAVELLDVEKLISAGGWMAGKSPSATPTSISWSPKGKQLALGLENGDIVTYSPTATATPKSSIPRPPSADSMSAIYIQWLSTTSFHAIYAPPGQLAPDVEQLHFHVSLDSKKNTIQDVKFNSPYLPFPGLRPPGAFMVCLRSWDPSTALLFIGDGTSSDIGLVGSVADSTSESWHNLSLEEVSMPSLPLDKDQNDTVMLGLDLDLTNDSIYRYSTPSGESLELNSPPIMYAYASDGTILGWYLLNTEGKVYPGMTSAPSVPSAMSAPGDVIRESSDMNTMPTAPAPAFMQTLSPPSDQPSTFGTLVPTLGQPSVFNQSASNQQRPSVFGQSSFGQATVPSPIVQANTPALVSTTTRSGGFEAFASASQVKFGQSTFGFGTLPAPTPPASAPPVETPPEESMAADDGPPLGGLGLGAENADEAEDSKLSIFGNAGAQMASTPQSSEGGLIKPGIGFGAFANLDQKSMFASAPSAVTPTTSSPLPFSAQTKEDGGIVKSTFGVTSQSSATFGVSAFGQKVSSFGHSGFGQSTFGQAQAGVSAFGKPSFGVTCVASPPSRVPPTGGGAFTAFASNTQNAFAASAGPRDGSARPVWATGSSSKPAPPKSVFSGAGPTNVFNELAGQTPSKPFSPLAEKAETSTLEKATPSYLATRESSIRDDESRSPSPVLVEQEEPVVPSSSTKPSIPAPPTTTPRPAVPKEPFGQWTPIATVKKEEIEPDLSSRPKTPPLLSTFSALPKISGPSISPVSMPALPTSPSTPPSKAPTHGSVSGPVNLFGKPAKLAEATASAKAATKSLNQSALVAPSVVPSVPPSAGPSPFVSTSSSAASSPPTSTTPEQGMQAECLYLLQTLARELENFKSLAAEASQKAFDIKKTSGVTHHKLDLGETRKWVLGDVKEYGRILADVQTDVQALKEQRVLLRKSLRDLDSNMLKAGTRKEEIVRFNRAKTDVGFAKMLKVRTLGPEYLETQSQLRRDIKVMRESVQRLEDHLQLSKKRLNEFKTGKPSLRAPSLDTVSRTFRNIDIAIDQQKREMNKLRIRMSKLDTQSLDGTSALDIRPSGSTSKRHSNVTPNVAATTAAALNAERSAQKLKRTLLAVRTEPLLNTKASEAHVLTSFQTPQKTPARKEAPEPHDELLSLPTTPLLRFPSSMAAWSPLTPPEFGDSASPGISPSRGRGGTKKHHQKPVTLKKVPNPTAATSAEFAPPADFAWKPLQPMKPISTLPFSITPKGSN